MSESTTGGFDMSWLSMPLMLAQGYAGHYSAQMAKLSGEFQMLEAERQAQLKQEDMYNYSLWLGRQRDRIKETHSRQIVPSLEADIVSAGISIKSSGELKRESQISLKRRLTDANYGSDTQIRRMRNEQQQMLRKGRAAKQSAEAQAYTEYFTTGIEIGKQAYATWGAKG